MTNPTRNQALLELIRQGLEYSNLENARATLGDRNAYLGISDLARYRECPRAALAAKAFPQQNSLEQLLAMQRGHWFENGLSECFQNLGLNFMSQLEIAVNHGDVPIRCHLDFTLVWNNPEPAIRILEIKSMNRVPDKPYPAHQFQAQAQVNLLHRYWNEPVFSLRDSTGQILSAKLTFPETCKEVMGISLPDKQADISVESWLLCLSMKEVSCFGPFGAEDAFMDDALELATKAWSEYSILRHGTMAFHDIPHASGYQPLCEYCLYAADCPKFRTSDKQPEWETVIKEIGDLKQDKEELESRIKGLEAQLKQAYILSDSKNWIETGSYRFRVASAAGRKSLDRESLQQELTDIFHSVGIDELDVEALFARHERTGAGYSRLNIMRIN